MRPHRTHAAPRRPRWRAAVLPSAIVALAGAWISGCSVLYDLKTEQCSTDADCDALGATFTGLACVEHLCQTPPGCNSHAECIQEFGSGGEPWACVDRSCVRMTTTECPSVLPVKNEGWLTALRSDNPVILAGTGVIDTVGTLTPGLRSYELAMAEVNRYGIQGGTRQVVMLACKANADEAEVDTIMTHVAQTLKIKGMIAAFYAQNLQRAFLNYGQAANMFFMSPLESDPLLATIGDTGLLWHIGPRPEVFGRAYAPLVTRTIAHLGLTENVRIATVTASDQRFLTAMLSTITDDPPNYGLTINGGSVADNLGTNYLGLTTTLGAPAATEQVVALLEFKPHIIISAAGPEFFSNIIAGVESGWDTGSGQPKPFYILSPYNYNDSVSLRALTTTNPALRSRLAGVNGAASEDTRNYTNYLTAYDGYFGLREAGYENYYDAAYYLLYSAAAVAATSALEGADFTRGMRRLLGGSQTFDVGELQLPQGLAAVSNGASIQLDGTLGPPTWNEDGTRDLLGSVYCVNSDDQFIGDVLRYREGTAGDASTVTLEGDFTCINGF
jgi:hypothetical protein